MIFAFLDIIILIACWEGIIWLGARIAGKQVHTKDYFLGKGIVVSIILPYYFKVGPGTDYFFRPIRIGVPFKNFVSRIFLLLSLGADGVRLCAVAVPLTLILKEISLHQPCQMKEYKLFNNYDCICTLQRNLLLWQRVYS